jgi:hypothetical protein
MIDSAVKVANAASNVGNTVNSFIGTALQHRMAKKQLEESKRQFDINTLLKKRALGQNEYEFDRSSGMNAIGMLADQRANAIQQFGNKRLKDSFFRG